MKSFFGDKTWVILLVIFAFLGLVVLAAGLGQMEFAQPFAIRLDRTSIPFEDSGVAGENLWFRYLIPGLFLLTFLLMLGPVRPQKGDSVMKALARAIAFILFFTLVMGPLARQSGLLSAEMLEGMPLPGVGEVSVEEFSPPSVTSGWAFWISSLLIVLFGVLAVMAINRAFDYWFNPKSGVGEIAEIARTALNDLSGAKPSKNVIIRCYMEMNRVVSETRGFVREEAMTPAEFAALLEGLGLPPVAVHGLTDVFERVRYGGQEAGAKDIKEAKRCLTDILEACQTKN